MNPVSNREPDGVSFLKCESSSNKVVIPRIIPARFL